MNELLNLGLSIKNNEVLVSTREIASKFGKDHKEVMYAIEGRIDSAGKVKNNGLLQEISGISHPSKYFISSIYRDSMNREQQEFLLTRDGFTLLAMGFSGSKALKWKLSYIEAFNYMEAILREKQSAEWKYSRLEGKKARKDETDVIMSKLIPHAESQGSKNAGKLYMNYSKLVNSTLGIQAGQRDNLPLSYIDAIRFLERAIENIISIEVDKGTHYKEIYQVCKAKCNIIKDLAFLPKLELLSA